MDRKDFDDFMRLTPEQAEQVYLWATSPGTWLDLSKRRILRPAETPGIATVQNNRKIEVSANHKDLEDLFLLLLVAWTNKFEPLIEEAVEELKREREGF